MKRYLWPLLYVLASFIGVVFMPGTALASGSWTSGTFSYGKEVVLPSSASSTQRCQPRNVSIGGPLSPKKYICVYERPNWRYAFYTEVTGPSYAPYHQAFFVVGIGSDTSMYKVLNPGYSNSYDVVHIPGTDDFMYNQLAMGFTNNHWLYIAKNFPSKLTLTYSGLERVYSLAENSYEPLLPNEFDQPATTGAVGVSPNGRWIAAEVMGTGLALMNTETYEMRLFSNYKHRYGLGSDAHIKFVVSNDGGHVAVFDYNIQPKVYSLSDSCVLGTSNIEVIRLHASDYVSCPDDGGLLWEALVSRFGTQAARSMSATEFNYDADTLHFIRTEYTNPELIESISYRLPLHAGDFHPTTSLEYLALGDSYASGEGDLEDEDGKSHYTPVTGYTGGCHISTRSYPFLLSLRYNLPDGRMQSVACSGAQIMPDYISNLQTYFGQNERLKEYSAEEREAQQQAGLDNFYPGRVPQIEFVKKYQPRVVTVMGGGNDVGFARILEYCASPSWQGFFVDDTCGYAVDGSELQHMLGVSIRDQYAYTKRLIAKVHEASPNTVVYVVGYPSFISDNPLDSCLNSGALDLEERKMLNEAVSYANIILERAAETSGAYFINIEDTLAGGRMCEGSLYVTGLWQVGLDRVVNEDIQEMFHPNSRAHQKIAEQLISQGFTIQATALIPTPDAPAPAIPKYFGVSSSSSPVSARQKQMTLYTDLPQQSSGELQLGVSSLQPGSSAILTIHSSPTKLGDFEVAQDGSLRAVFTLPESIKPGRHVLVLEGTSPSGEIVKIFQFLTVTSGGAEDIDGDGIADELDTCMFIAKWYNEQTGEDVCVPKKENQSPDTPSPTSPKPESVNKVGGGDAPESPVRLIGMNGDEFTRLVALNSTEESHSQSNVPSGAHESAGDPALSPDPSTGPDGIPLLLTFAMTIGAVSVILIALKYAKGRYGQ